MKVLSLFDGISCGRVALERAGVKVSTYYASEIDKYAEAVSKKNYPDIIRLGDVRNIDFSQFIGKIDLIIGGSPCQDLSIAKQNRQGLSGERSGLFWKFVEAVETIKPKYFMLENVASMSQENKELISKTLGVESILINSALVSAQQRKRLYWCNWANDLPEDKGILLQDILETGEAWNDKSHCLTSSYKGAIFPHDFLRHQRQMVAEPVGCALRSRENKKQLEVRKDKKSNAMTSARTDSMVCSPVRLGSLGKPSQGNRVYSVKGKSVCLSAQSGGKGAKTGLYKIDLPDGDYMVRKLSPTECERLQTLPEGYTEGVSNTQRYKAIGNGWTVDVLVHLFKKLE
ncbi:MAG: DNA (cytosine-5-)-methyltransferase [Alphaproteobacteria bacterium]